MNYAITGAIVVAIAAVILVRQQFAIWRTDPREKRLLELKPLSPAWSPPPLHIAERGRKNAEMWAAAREWHPHLEVRR